MSKGYTHVIAGMRGIGRRYMEKQQEKLGLKIIHVDWSKFRYLENSDETYPANPEYPKNMADAIYNLCTSHVYDIIFCSAEFELLEALKQVCIHPLVVYPEKSEFDEYVKRTQLVFDTEEEKVSWKQSWIDVVDKLENLDIGRKYRLRAGQYMSDVPLHDYKEMGFHMEYRDWDNPDNNKETHCCFCKRPINKHSNFYTNNISDICVSCEHEIGRYFQKDEETPKYDVEG